MNIQTVIWIYSKKSSIFYYVINPDFPSVVRSFGLVAFDMSFAWSSRGRHLVTRGPSAVVDTAADTSESRPKLCWYLQDLVNNDADTWFIWTFSTRVRWFGLGAFDMYFTYLRQRSFVNKIVKNFIFGIAHKYNWTNSNLERNSYEWSLMRICNRHIESPEFERPNYWPKTGLIR